MNERGGERMKIEGSIQELKEFMKEFQSTDRNFSKQQLNQIKEEISKVEIKIDGEKVGKQFKPSTLKL